MDIYVYIKKKKREIDKSCMHINRLYKEASAELGVYSQCITLKGDMMIKSLFMYMYIYTHTVGE